jgi:hypothetical protein
MANQIVVSSGAKVRDLNDVIIGTSGVLSSLAFNVANGVPKLDVNGKILVSQLPNSVMEYKGTWDASTNTPTLVNGTGNQGDVYLCNVAGTVNFGAGPIAFFVGDQVIYSGTIWQRASGASGTVTSVAVTESGDALTITGSPITTSGTINIGFAGSAGQYINGAGGLTTFPSLTGYVPYTGATANVDLGTFNLTADVITGSTGSFTSSGGSDTFAINHSSGSGIALNITKGGNSEGLYINKTSGSGNAATIVGTLEATTLVKSGGTSSQFLKADGSVDSSTYLTTSAAASTYVPYTGATANVDLGTFNLSTLGTLLSKYVYVVGDGTNSGFLSFSQYATPDLSGTNATSIYTTSNNKVNFRFWQSGVSYKNFNFDVTSLTAGSNITFTLPDLSGTLALGTGTTNYVSKWTGTNTIGNSLIFDNGTNVGIGNTNTSYTLDVSGTGRFTGGITAQTGEFLSGGQDGSVGSVVRIGTTNTNAAARNWGIVNSWDNFGDLTFRVSNAQGGNALSAGSTKMVILSSGNVGIGTSSPFAIADINTSINGSGSSALQLGVGGTRTGQFFASSTEVRLGSVTSVPLRFFANDAEAMRITSGGTVLIGTATTDAFGARLLITGSTSVYNLLSIQDTGTAQAGVYYIAFWNSAGSLAGGVQHQTASTVVYYTGPSDQRLKTNIKDVEESVLPLFNDVKLKTYNHIADEDESVVYKGFLAQDMVDNFPEAYGKDKDGYYMYNPTGYIPYLVKAIQEQQALITSLQEQVNELKNK